MRSGCERVAQVAALACIAALGGCASYSEKVVETMSSLPAVGLPAGAPERPPTVAEYPAVHDMPRVRAKALLNDVEQQRVEDELTAARNRQRAAAGLPPLPTAAVTPAKKPAQSAGDARVVPASSSATIY